MTVSLNVWSPSLADHDLDHASYRRVLMDGEVPADTDRFDAPTNRGEDEIFGTRGELGELKKPDPRAGNPTEPQAFVVPVLVAAGAAVVVLATGVIGGLIANEITRKVHETNQTMPPPPPPQAQPPSRPPNPQAGIVITPLPTVH